MEEYYILNGLIKLGKCMYCLEDLDVANMEETAEHFGVWCEVMPGCLKREARLQWAYVEKLIKAGWYDEGVDYNLNPPSILEDARPGFSKKKKRKIPVVL